jgi:hypothetical protein
MSGVNMNGNQIRKGAVDAITKYLALNGSARMPPEVRAAVERLPAGGTPLVVCRELGKRAGRDSPEGHRQGWDARALRSVARHGHQAR